LTPSTVTSRRAGRPASINIVPELSDSDSNFRLRSGRRIGNVNGFGPGSRGTGVEPTQRTYLTDPPNED